MKTMDDNFNSIDYADLFDYADLYDVKPGEKDFGGANAEMREMRREEVINSLQYNAAKEALRRNASSADDFEDGAEYGYQFAIDKVCKWIETNWEDFGCAWIRGYSGKDVTDFLKEEIENGQAGQGTTS